MSPRVSRTSSNATPHTPWSPGAVVDICHDPRCHSDGGITVASVILAKCPDTVRRVSVPGPARRTNRVDPAGREDLVSRSDPSV